MGTSVIVRGEGGACGREKGSAVTAADAGEAAVPSENGDAPRHSTLISIF